MRGVVGGIGHYGNCIGVPTVGGELYFDAGYDGNILVNAFTIGIAPARPPLPRVAPPGPGNPVIYVGSRTGRDGIHGASLLASAALRRDRREEKRPAVQVGDPFTEKLLLEACLELMQTDHVVAHPGHGRGRPHVRARSRWRGAAAPASCSISTRCRSARRG